MQIIKGYHPNEIHEGTAVALGMFDGVHLAHQQIIKHAIDYAKKYNLKSAAITLTKHPRELIQGKAPALLTDLDSKLSLFEELGLDYVLLLDFDEALRAMAPGEYLQKYLIETLNSKFISVGYDHHFGKDRSAGPNFLRSWCEEHGLGLYVSEPVSVKDELVGSSRIREYIQEGNISKANLLLGRNYFVSGLVAEGDKRGSQIGFPTANIDLPAQVALPALGVYVAEIKILGEKHTAVVNIGKRPTFKDNDEPVVEAHILDFDKNIYGMKVELSFIDRLRDEIKFSSQEELIAQIEKDIALVIARRMG